MSEPTAALLAFAGRRGGAADGPSGLAALLGMTAMPMPIAEPAEDRIAAREAELDAALAQVRAFIAKLAADNRVDPAHVRAEVAGLALAVTTAVIGGAPDLLAAGVESRVDAVLAGFAERHDRATLHLSPADLALMGATWPGLAVVADATLTAGSFRLVHGDAEVADSLADRLTAAADWLTAR